MSSWWDRLGGLWNGLWTGAHDAGLMAGAPIAPEQALDALVLGVAVGVAALVVLGALNLYQALSLRVAGRRVAALVALSGMRPAGQLKRELLAAFGHSRRLRALAERFLSRAETAGAEQPERLDGSPILDDRQDHDLAGEKGASTATALVLGAAICLAGFGGVGVPCLLIGLFAPASLTVAGSVVDLTALLYALRLGSLFALGCGVAGLLGLLEWRALLAVQRHAVRRLKAAVDRLIASSSGGEAAMIAYARQSGATHKALEKLLKDEKKARALERRDFNDRLDRATAQIEQGIQSMNECATACTELCGLIRQSMDTIIGTQERLKEMFEEHRLQAGAANQSLAADEARRAAEDQSLAASVRDAAARLASLVDALSAMARPSAGLAASSPMFPGLTPESAESMISELQSMLGELGETGARLAPAGAAQSGSTP